MGHLRRGGDVIGNTLLQFSDPTGNKTGVYGRRLISLIPGANAEKDDIVPAILHLIAKVCQHIVLVERICYDASYDPFQGDL